jgi:GNAT superfamily N-acetyltransferase
MITYQQESLFDIVNEVDDLLRLHYEELCLNRDKIKLDPMWDRYAELERSGNLVLFTVRDDKKLIGYSAFLVTKHLHYGMLTLAINDVLFLHPDYRSGRIGIKLIRMCESYFEDIKTPDVEIKMVWHAKFDTSLEKLLRSMNYTAEEISFGRIL